MTITRLDIENIKRLSAVSIDASGLPIVTIGGRNANGKSSTLDAISMALGGKKLCPPEPIRRGADEGRVTVDLGDKFRVTRRFWRDGEEIKSSLTVTSPDGTASYKSPQAMLDALVSDLTFDPLAFLALGPSDQREMVRQLVGLDFTKLDAQRNAALEAVRECETVVKVAEHDVKAGEYYPEAPATLVDAATLLQQLAGAEQAEKAAVDAEQQVAAKRAAFERVGARISERVATIAKIREALEEAELSLEADRAMRGEIISEGEALKAAAEQARAAVPDTSVIRQQLSEANTINARVQANQRHAALLDARDQARRDLADARGRIKVIDAEKQQHLNAAQFPVAGLSFGDDGLMFDGLPFEQASHAQQLRVAVAMGLSEHPDLRVLLIKDGSALDSTSLALLTQLAEEHGAQVWLERVAESAEGVSVFITDGRVEAVAGETEASICHACGVEWRGAQRACACAAEAVSMAEAHDAA